MGSTAIRIGPLLGTVLVALAGAAAVAAAGGRLGTARATVTASVRAVVQLAVVFGVIVAVVPMAGILIGGAMTAIGPVQAGAARVLVLIGLLAAETVGVLVTVELVAHGWLRRPGSDNRP